MFAVLPMGVICIVGLAVLVRLWLCLQIVTVEGHGAGSFRRSYALTRGYFWKTSALLLLMAVPFAFSNVLTRWRVGELAHGSYAAVTAAGLLISTAAVPLIVGSEVLLYLALRTKQEGLSPKALIRELDAV